MIVQQLADDDLTSRLPTIALLIPVLGIEICSKGSLGSDNRTHFCGELVEFRAGSA